MQKIGFLILFVSIIFLYSCKPDLKELEQSQTYNKEIIRFITNMEEAMDSMEETMDLLEVVLEEMTKQIEENRIEIDELQTRIYQLEKEMKDIK